MEERYDESPALHRNSTLKQACAFPLESYTWKNIEDVFQRVQNKWPDSRIKAALWNAAQWSRIPFLEVTEKVSTLIESYVLLLR